MRDGSSFFFQAEDGIRDIGVTGVQTCALPIFFFPYMFMRSIGVAGSFVVFVSVAAALTLLPALLGVLGHKINALSLRRRRRSSEPVGASFWARSAEIVIDRKSVV